MKNIIASFIFVITALCTLAQAPQSFNYQAVLRDAAGNILGNKDVEIQVKILQGSASGSTIFSETHSTTTNNFGLVNLSVGSISSTDLSNIDWTDGPFFIQISVDGTVMGTSQLLSVPFAMHAISVENDAVEDDDANPENEIQVLSINADTIFLSSGGFVVLPPEIDPAFTSWDKSSGITISESQISDLKHFTSDSISGNENVFEGWDKNVDDDFTTADETDPVFSNSLAAAITAADTARWASNNDIQNELQNLSIENQQLSISGGNTIDLSDAYYIADSSATNELQDISLNGTQLSISKGSTVDLAEVQDGDKQRLSLGVTNQHDIRLNISNANFVEMPFVKDGVSKYNWDEAENYVAKWGQYGVMEESTIYDNGNIGIGIEKPSAKLEVAGQVRITGGEPGADKILVSDANGLATWKPNLDNDPTNELQELSISNDTISLSDGGSVKLPNETDPVYAADSASLKNAIVKNKQAIIDTAAQLRNILATKKALADTVVQLRAYFDKLLIQIGETDKLLAAGYTVKQLYANGHTVADLIAVGASVADLVSAGATTASDYIGLFYQGGVIFYVNTTNATGLICAVSDCNSLLKWSNFNNTTGATGSGIGAGQKNTALILKSDGSSADAAYYCDTLTMNGYDDWFLPSIGELQAMYRNKAAINTTAENNGGSSFVDKGHYWSSNEDGAKFARYKTFNSNSNFGFEKYVTFKVRAVRAF